MRQIEILANKMKEAGFNVKTWRGRRIYFNGLGKDTTAYIEVDDDEDFASEDDAMKYLEGDVMAGCALKVWINANQTRKWLVNRYNQQKHRIMTQLSETGVCNWPITENWQEVL